MSSVVVANEQRHTEVSAHAYDHFVDLQAFPHVAVDEFSAQYHDDLNHDHDITVHDVHASFINARAPHHSECVATFVNALNSFDTESISTDPIESLPQPVAIARVTSIVPSSKISMLGYGYGGFFAEGRGQRVEAPVADRDVGVAPSKGFGQGF